MVGLGDTKCRHLVASFVTCSSCFAIDAIVGGGGGIECAENKDVSQGVCLRRKDTKSMVGKVWIKWCKRVTPERSGLGGMVKGEK